MAVRKARETWDLAENIKDAKISWRYTLFAPARGQKPPLAVPASCQANASGDSAVRSMAGSTV